MGWVFELVADFYLGISEWLASDDDPPDSRPGLSEGTYRVQFALSVAVSIWISFQVNTQIFDQLSSPLIALLAAPFTTGFVYIGAGLLGIAFIVATNLFGQRSVTIRRMWRLLVLIGGLIILIVVYTWIAEHGMAWQRSLTASGTDDELGDILLKFVLLLVVGLGSIALIIAFFAAIWVILGVFVFQRATMNSAHSLLAPIVDIEIAIYGAVVLVLADNPGGGTLIAAKSCSLLILLGFAVIDLCRQRGIW